MKSLCQVLDKPPRNNTVLRTFFDLECDVFVYADDHKKCLTSLLEWFRDEHGDEVMGDGVGIYTWNMSQLNAASVPCPMTTTGAKRPPVLLTAFRIGEKLCVFGALRTQDMPHTLEDTDFLTVLEGLSLAASLAPPTATSASNHSQPFPFSSPPLVASNMSATNDGDTVMSEVDCASRDAMDVSASGMSPKGIVFDHVSEPLASRRLHFGCSRKQQLRMVNNIRATLCPVYLRQSEVDEGLRWAVGEINLCGLRRCRALASIFNVMCIASRDGEPAPLELSPSVLRELVFGKWHVHDGRKVDTIWPRIEYEGDEPDPMCFPDDDRDIIPPFEFSDSDEDSWARSDDEEDSWAVESESKESKRDLPTLDIDDPVLRPISYNYTESRASLFALHYAHALAHHFPHQYAFLPKWVVQVECEVFRHRVIAADVPAHDVASLLHHANRFASVIEYQARALNCGRNDVGKTIVAGAPLGTIVPYTAELSLDERAELEASLEKRKGRGNLTLAQQTAWSGCEKARPIAVYAIGTCTLMEFDEWFGDDGDSSAFVPHPQDPSLSLVTEFHLRHILFAFHRRSLQLMSQAVARRYETHFVFADIVKLNLLTQHCNAAEGLAKELNDSLALAKENGHAAERTRARENGKGRSKSAAVLAAHLVPVLDDIEEYLPPCMFRATLKLDKRKHLGNNELFVLVSTFVQLGYSHRDIVRYIAKQFAMEHDLPKHEQTNPKPREDVEAEVKDMALTILENYTAYRESLDDTFESVTHEGTSGEVGMQTLYTKGVGESALKRTKRGNGKKFGYNCSGMQRYAAGKGDVTSTCSCPFTTQSKSTLDALFAEMGFDQEDVDEAMGQSTPTKCCEALCSAKARSDRLFGDDMGLNSPAHYTNKATRYLLIQYEDK